MNTLTILRPDDWHVHLRDDDVLQHTVAATAKHFARALVMPNLKPPLTTLESILAYRQRILSALKNENFTPFMTFYLNESVSMQDLQATQDNPYILGAKLYPAGATTNSELGARSLQNVYPQLEVMQAAGLVLQIHGEITHGDIFARESRFLEEQLAPLLQDFPNLRVVLEHISTKEAVDFVQEASPYVAATITPHHLLYNRNHLLAGGIKPHYYCLPILKAEQDQQALQQAAVSGNSKFFAGTDSAPHARTDKESACGCAGIYSAPFALAMYAQVFSSLDKMDKLEDFLSRFGAEFYHLPINETYVELIASKQLIPQTLPLGNKEVVPASAGEYLHWSVNE